MWRLGTCQNNYNWKKKKRRKLRPVCPISTSFFRSGNVTSTGCSQGAVGLTLWSSCQEMLWGLWQLWANTHLTPSPHKHALNGPQSCGKGMPFSVFPQMVLLKISIANVCLWLISYLSNFHIERISAHILGPNRKASTSLSQKGWKENGMDEEISL